MAKLTAPSKVTDQHIHLKRPVVLFLLLRELHFHFHTFKTDNVWEWYKCSHLLLWQEGYEWYITLYLYTLLSQTVVICNHLIIIFNLYITSKTSLRLQISFARVSWPRLTNTWTNTDKYITHIFNINKHKVVQPCRCYQCGSCYTVYRLK